MRFNLNTDRPVLVLLGAGAMGTAIARRFGNTSTIFLGDYSTDALESRTRELQQNGFSVEAQQVDATDPDSLHAFAQQAAKLGAVKYFIDTAGASPNQASAQHIIDLDLIGTSVAIDEFATVMAAGGSGLIISSQAGHMHRFSDEEEHQLTTTPTNQLGELDVVKTLGLSGSGPAYMVAKRANHLRVQAAAATTWAQARARINTISPGIIVTPLAYDEFNAEGEGYQKMIDASAARRVGTVDEIADAAEFLLSDRSSFVTGTDLLIDGGVIASMVAGTFSLG